MKLLGQPRLPEERDVHDAGLINQRHLGHRKIRPWVFLVHTVDARNDGCDLTYRGLLDRQGMLKIKVTPRNAGKKVPHRVNPPPTKRLLARS